jgi:hypothetical protein
MYTSTGGEVSGGEVMLGEKQANILKSWHFVVFPWVKKKFSRELASDKISLYPSLPPLPHPLVLAAAEIAGNGK